MSEPTQPKKPLLTRLFSRRSSNASESKGPMISSEIDATPIGSEGFTQKASAASFAPKTSAASTLMKFFQGAVRFRRESSEIEFHPEDCAQDPFSVALGAAGAKDERKGMFIDAASMKEKLRQNMDKPKYNVASYYHRSGLFQHIATHKVFEGVTLSVIAFNALWISIDTDYNHAEMLITATPVFQIAEHFFCTYFAFEWFCRFMAFKRKRNGLKDAWFVFDSIMVIMMVLETWVMTMVMLATGAGGSGGMGNASILRLARLLRLSRMARMARLLRAMPELMILIKGMVAAMRSVFFTMMLLAILVYVFGILFTQLTAETIVGDTYFYSVPKSMHTLLLDGTLLDNPGVIVRALGDESLLFSAIFYIFILIASLTVMNMLIGVLCEVVSAVAETEKEELTVGYVHEQLESVIKDTGLDEDGDGEISIEEFKKILENQKATRMLQEVGVDVEGLIDIADFIFDQGDDDAKDSKDGDDDCSERSSERKSDKPKHLTAAKFMDIVLQLRGTNSATVKDIVDFRKFVSQITTRLKDKVDRTAFYANLPVSSAVARRLSSIPLRASTLPALQPREAQGSKLHSARPSSDDRAQSRSKLEKLLRDLNGELAHIIGSVGSASFSGHSPLPGQPVSSRLGVANGHDREMQVTLTSPQDREGYDLMALQHKLTKLKDAVKDGLPVVISTQEKLAALKRRESSKTPPLAF